MCLYLRDEEARDSPVRKGRQTLAVGASALDARQLGRGPELAPAYAGRAIVHEYGVSPTYADSALVFQSVLQRRLGCRQRPLGERSCTNSRPHAVVRLNEPREIGRGRLIQRCNTKGSHRSRWDADRATDADAPSNATINGA